MEIRVLGPIEVVDAVSTDGVGREGETETRNVAFGGPIPHRILALLVAAGSYGVSIETLVEQLWDSADLPVDPVGSIRTYVARLRTTIGSESIDTGHRRYILNLESLTTDVFRFEQLVVRARRESGSPGATELWREALDLWRGPAFGDQADLEPVRLEANRLDELRAEATEGWIDAHLVGGAGREIVADVEAAVAQFPLREGFRLQQMTVLARVGRQPDALRAFQEFRAELGEIGLEPSGHLSELDRQIAAGIVPQPDNSRTLRGYELGDVLGEGAFAVVYQGIQKSIGRPVAVKQIRSRLADQPEFIRQFEAEAHLVARLEHPHIVPLYDYWREPGSAYLIMRYLDGGSLNDRSDVGAMELDELVPMVTQIAAALETAHAAGIIHRDVKPANILLDRVGNAYLSDFGIAVEEAERLDPQGWLSQRSVAFSSPEQLRHLPVGPTADVYALAATTHQMLTTRVPFMSSAADSTSTTRDPDESLPLLRSSRPEIPVAVDTVVRKATATRPEARYQTPGEFAAELAIAAGLDSETRLIKPQQRNPYKGLRPFAEADSADFVGRERLVAELLFTVHRERMLMVVGPSGSGKSSVVRAGLMPALRSNTDGGTDQWLVSTMVPGHNPLRALETALLRVAVDPPPDVVGMLRADSRGLSRLITRVVPEGRELVLVIDQLEELFVLSSGADRDLLLDALVEATTVENQRLRVIATIRADFYDHPLRHPAFADLIHGKTIAVQPMNAGELERAIAEPAKAIGVSFEPGLVATISADVANQPGSLPLLQYALTELYDRRKNSLLQTSAYLDSGGVSAAIARRAEDVFGAMTESEQTAASRALTRMVTAHEGAEDTGRRVMRSELADDAATSGVLHKFGEARLVAFDRDPRSREPTVEVAHEALIREWPRLQEWLQEDREGLRVLRHLTETSTGWASGGRQPGELYRAGRLETALVWKSEHQAELNEIESEFLAASVAARDAEQAAELRVNHRLRMLAELASENADLATANAAIAETRRLIADAANLAEENVDLALLLAAEAYNRDPSVTSLAGLQRVLTKAGNHLGTLGAATTYFDVHWAKRQIVAVAADRVHVYDAESELLNREISLGKTAAGSSPVSRREYTNVSRLDGNLLVVNPGQQQVLLIDIASGDVAQIDHPAMVTSVAVNQSKGLLAVGDSERRITLYQTPLGEEIDAADVSLIRSWSIEGFSETSLKEITFPFGFELSSVPFYDQLFQSFESFIFENGVKDVVFGPEGDLFAATGIHVRRFDLETGQLLAESIAMSAAEGVLVPTFPGLLSVHHDQLVTRSVTGSVVFDSNLGQTSDIPFDRGRLDGNLLIKASAPLLAGDQTFVGVLTNGDVSVARETAGEVVTSLMSTRAVNPVNLALSPDGEMAAMVGGKGIALVALRGRQLLANSVPRSGLLLPSISPNGQRITVSSLGTALPAVTHDLETGDQRMLVSGDVAFPPSIGSPVVESLWFLSDDLLMAMGREDRSQPYRAFLLDGRTLEFRMELPGFEFGERVSPDGNLLVVGRGRGGDPEAPLLLFFIDLETNAVVDSLDLAPWAEASLVDRVLRTSDFSVDGTRLLTTFPSGRAVVIDVASRTVIESFEPAANGAGSMTTATFSPDGQILATRDGSGSIDIRDAQSYEILYSLAGGTDSSENLTLGPYFSPDSAYLLTTREQRPRLWHLETRTDLGTFPVEEGLGIEGSTGPDRLNLVTGVADSVLVWNLDTDDWLDIACRAAGRNLSRAEWEQFGPTDTAYHRTCLRWP